ncbi:MAG: Gfo/Idh/MocA family oxidoreductase [Firmicutes bacterium]|nr:Gfo/Idh/MocA family oxidoreductase [Bacillota bacterium]
MKTRVGIIGGGRMARAHAIALSRIEDVEVVGLADRFPQGAALSRELGLPYFTDYRAMLEKPLDAVTVCLPHTLHREVVEEAARAGRHVLCEKPMATTLEDCDAMIDACERAGVRLMIGQTHRFWPASISAKQLISAGRIGRPIMAQDWIAWAGFYPGYPGWLADNRLAGGGILLDNGVHSLDRLSWFFDSRSARVTARLGQYVHPIDGEDNGVMLVEFENGAYATVFESWTFPRHATECAALIAGTKGAIRLNTWGKSYLLTSDSDGPEEIPIPEGADGFDLQLMEFVASIREGRRPSVDGYDGRAAVAAVLAAYESERCRRGQDIRHRERPAE